jgi:hypothetical protein
MRAARYDLVVETGAKFTREFGAWVPDLPALARTITPGTRVYYKGDPLNVYSAVLTEHPTDHRQSTVALVFNTGAWFEPRVTIPADDLIYPAMPVSVVASEAAFTTIVGVNTDRVTLPTRVVDGSTVLLEIPDTDEFAPYVGAWSWDLYAQTVMWGWQRLVAGTLSVIRGVGRVHP